MLGKVLGSIFVALIGRFIEYFRRRELEKQAARAHDLERTVKSMREAGEQEDKVRDKVAELKKQSGKVQTTAEKLDKIRRFNEAMRG